MNASERIRKAREAESLSESPEALARSEIVRELNLDPEWIARGVNPVLRGLHQHLGRIEHSQSQSASMLQSEMAGLRGRVWDHQQNQDRERRSDFKVVLLACIARAA